MITIIVTSIFPSQKAYRVETYFVTVACKTETGRKEHGKQFN